MGHPKPETIATPPTARVGGIVFGPQDVAAYIAAMSTELARMAGDAGLVELAAKLAEAAEEGERVRKALGKER